MRLEERLMPNLLLMWMKQPQEPIRQCQLGNTNEQEIIRNFIMNYEIEQDN